MSLTSNVTRVVVAVVGVILAVSVFVTNAKDCTQENVNECLKSMVKETGNDTRSPIVPTRTEEEMRKRCSDYKDFQECLKPITPNCGKVDQLVFEGIDNYYDYFCDQKFDEYLKHRECFKNGELHKEGTFCNSTFTSRLKSLKNQHYSTSHLRDRVCQYVEDYLDCVENVVTSFCGKEAARWQRGLDVTSLTPILNTIQCPGWPPKDPSDWRLPAKTNRGLVVGLVVCFVLLLLAAGALLAMKLWQKPKRQTTPNGFVWEPYASYNGQDVNMYPGVPPPGANPQGSAAAGPLPVKAPPYPESLPPAYDSAGYDNPTYGANPSDDFRSEEAIASANAIAPPSVVPSHRDGSNDK